MSDIILGLVGRDYVLLGADQAVTRSITVLKQNEDKILPLEPNKLLACGGSVGDRSHFTEFISKNVQLYSLRTGIELSTHATAEFTRHQLAEAIRKGPYEVNILLGGWEEKSGPELYYLDYLGSMHKVPHAAHGYCSYYALSLFDKFYQKDMNIEEGLQVFRVIVKELQLRFPLHFGPIKVKVVDKEGIREVNLEG
jgi:20S proteasome subunit beta 4